MVNFLDYEVAEIEKAVLALFNDLPGIETHFHFPFAFRFPQVLFFPPAFYTDPGIADTLGMTYLLQDTELTDWLTDGFPELSRKTFYQMVYFALNGLGKIQMHGNQ